jgi:TetR/AcrR family tetracycline transcriptional repressor
MAMTDSPRAQRRPRRPLLTREAVLEAAARVMQRDGHAGLTMRAIADDLKVQAPALYWYVASKDELELLLYDHLMQGFSVSVSGDDWRDHIRQAAQQLRQHMRGRRDIAMLGPRDYAMGPGALAQLDGALAILLGAGLNPRDAAYAFTLLFGYIVDWASAEEWAVRRPKGEPPGGLDPAALAAIDPKRFPNIAAAGEHLASDDPDGRFEFGLECMIAGLERRVLAGD